MRRARSEAVVGRALLWYPRLDSTQTELRRLLDTGAETGTVVLAETQSAGRGRRGRRWQDRPGQDLLFSALLEVADLPPGLVPVALGAGLAQALSGATGAGVRSQWPNDLVVNDAKVAGLLVELVAGRYLVGLGVNVRGTSETASRSAGRPATTLEQVAGRHVERGAVLAVCLEALETVACCWTPETALRAIAEQDCLRGKRVVIQQAHGELRGLAEGVSSTGALLLKTESGTVEVVVADAVRVEPQS